MRKAVLLDRDGVINKDSGYVYKIEDFIFLQGVFDALRIFEKMKYLIIIITNQSGIARGYFSSFDYEMLTKEYLSILDLNGIKISACYHCPHHPQFSKFPYNNCQCRKPNTGMFIKAIKDFNLDITTSIAIGDNVRDLQPAHDLGILKKFLISSSTNNNGSPIITREFNSLVECAKFISN